MNATLLAADLIRHPTLVRNAIGEYTARSVAADPRDAAALRLVEQPDGAYASAQPRPFVAGFTAARAAAALQPALQALRLGG